MTLLLVVAGCGGQAAAPVVAPAVEPVEPAEPPPENEPEEPIDWDAVATQPEAAAAAWRMLIARADARRANDSESREVPDVITDIPLEPETVMPAMVRAFLREGRIGCPTLPAEPKGCATPAPELGWPAMTASYDDPCWRRELAFWALNELVAEDAELLAAELAALVAMPAPEDELIRDVFGSLPAGNDALRLRLLAAIHPSNRALRDDLVGGLSDQGMTEAATALHIDGAVLALDAATSPAVVTAAIADRELRPETRLRAIADAAALDGKPLLAALTTATTDPDCALAIAAAVDLARRGDKRHLPTQRPSAHKPDAERRLCLLVHAPDALRRASLAPLVGRRGIREILVDDVRRQAPSHTDADGDHVDPAGNTERVIPRKGADLPFLEDLRRCRTHIACAPGGGFSITATVIRDGGAWVLDAVTRRNTAGC